MRGAPKIAVGLHNSDIVNLERAVLERVFFCKENGAFARPPLPNRDLFNARLREFSTKLKRITPSTNRMTYDQFVNCYVARKRETYRLAVESLRTRGVTKRDANLKSFVKAEKLNFSAKPDPTPRVIQPRSPRYNVEVGRYLKPLEHPLYKAIDRVFGRDTIVKGKNMVEVAAMIRGAWAEFDDPVAVMADANRFDQHVSRVALEWEHSIYLRAFAGAERHLLNTLLSWQIHNKAFGFCENGTIKYSVVGSRMSGDMNTAMGNVLIMCALVYAYSREVGVRIRLINNGDDCVFIMNKRDHAKFNQGFQAWFMEMGFSMTVSDPVKEIELIKFCQAQPVFDGESWLMVRCPNPGLAKDMSCVLALDHALYPRWLHAVGVGGQALCGGIPVYNALYQRYMKEGAHMKVLEREQLATGFTLNARLMRAKGQGRVFGEPTKDARVSFWKAFGILPSQQVEIELLFSNLELSWGVDSRRDESPGDPSYLVGTSDLPGI